MARALTKSPMLAAGNGIKPPLRGKSAVLPVTARAKQAARKVSASSNGAGGKLRGTARLFTIIEHLAARPGRIVDVTRELGLPWATVHRTVAQLAKANFLRRDPETHRYEIGPSLWYAGTSYVANHRVLRAAMPYLHKAEQIHGIAVQLTERIGYQAVNIYSAQPYATDISKAQYGYHFPLHCGSKGKVLLAFSDPEFVEEYLRRPLEKLTDFSITDPAMLRKELSDVRRRGYSVTIADVQPFTGSIAAPVRDSSGRVVAAICFLGRKTLIQSQRRREQLLEHLQHAAHSASIDLGWRPDPAERHTRLIQRRS
jgi:DNA-binding IclR family transcriptional regulator